MLFNIGEFNVVCSVYPDKLAKEFSKYDDEDKAKFFNYLSMHEENKDIYIEAPLLGIIGNNKHIKETTKRFLVLLGKAAEESLNNQEDK